jgi:AraC family transcriptional regulator of adaptative response / DNA-3-methyladenine glycosylase II
VLAIAPALVPVVMPLVARVRRLFDLDARPDVIAHVLGRDRVLGPLVAARPGLRLPGALDGFEAAIRAMLGQQISVTAATTLAGRFAAAFGAPHADGVVFPSAKDVVAAGPDRIAAIGMPRTRAAAIHALATAIASNALDLQSRNLDAFVAKAIELPGIGPWTAHYLAMRALHLTDAFPAADLGVMKALAATAREAEALSAAWRPFRSYAVMHLWTGGSHVDDPRIAARNAPPRRASRRAGRGTPAAARRSAARRGDAHAAARRDRAPAHRVLRG